MTLWIDNSVYERNKNMHHLMYVLQISLIIIFIYVYVQSPMYKWALLPTYFCKFIKFVCFYDSVNYSDNQLGSNACMAQIIFLNFQKKKDAPCMHAAAVNGRRKNLNIAGQWRL